MAARTATPTGAAASALFMDPTMTEHDWRFPRRPDHRSASHRVPVHSNRGRQQDAGDFSIDELQMDQSMTQSAAKSRLVGSGSLFPSLQNDVPAVQSLDQMQTEDPLAMQVWKFFAHTKMQIPNQQRMENLTWRMMALKLPKPEQPVAPNRSVPCLPLLPALASVDVRIQVAWARVIARSGRTRLGGESAQRFSPE